MLYITRNVSSDLYRSMFYVILLYNNILIVWVFVFVFHRLYFISFF